MPLTTWLVFLEVRRWSVVTDKAHCDFYFLPIHRFDVFHSYSFGFIEIRRPISSKDNQVLQGRLWQFLFLSRGVLSSYLHIWIHSKTYNFNYLSISFLAFGRHYISYLIMGHIIRVLGFRKILKNVSTWRIQV